MAKKTRMKDFGSPAVEEELSYEPVYFKLYGEEYECHGNIQGIKTLQLIKKLTDEDDAIDGILDFFDSVLVPESKERFDELANDPKKEVKVELLSEIIAYIMEEYTDRDPKE